MAWTPISNVATGSSDSLSVTTGAIDTTGADIIFFAHSFYDATSPHAPSDSKSNTWVQVVDSTNTFDARLRLFYASAATGAFSVGSGHTFSIPTVGSSVYPAISAAAFSGSATSSVVDPSTNGTANSGAVSIQPGSITPASAGELVISALAINLTAAASASIDSSFTPINFTPAVGSECIGISMAYLVYTSGAENPTWSWTGSGDSAAVIAAFNAAAGVTLMGAALL